MKLVFRLLRVALGLILAWGIMAVAFTTVSGATPDLWQVVFDAAETASIHILAADDPARAMLGNVDFVKRLLCAVFVMPVLISAATGELFRLSSAWWHILVPGLIASAIPWLLTFPDNTGNPLPAPADASIAAMLLFTGLVGGAVYWLVAGRSAWSKPVNPGPPQTI